MYSVGEFAKLIGKSVRTVQQWDRDKTFIANRNLKQRRFYTEKQLLEYKGLTASEKSKVIAYIRVSNKNQADDLRNQKKFISEFCLNRGLEIDEWYEDIGSGLNFNRKNFNKFLSEVEHGKIKKLVIAHKDRFVRFGFDWFAKFCEAHGCDILLINNEVLSPEQEIVKDLISIIHVFSCRIYGLRKYKSEIGKEIKHQNK